MTPLLVLLTLIVAYVIVRKVRAWGKYKKYPPSVKALWLPGVGHVPGFGKEPVEFLLKQQKELGDVFSFELFGRDCVFMSGMEAVQTFYKTPDEILSAKEAYKFTVPAFGPNVVYDIHHKKFQEQRRFILQILTVPQFKTFVPIIEEEVTKYLDEEWKEEGKLDFYRSVSEIIIRTSTRCLQGEQIRSFLDKGYVDWMEDIDNSLGILAFFFPYLPLPTFRKRDIARKKVGDIIQQVLHHRLKNNYTADDFLQLLKSKQYKNGENLTDEEISGLSVALMLAGHHTSNITSSWLGIYLMTHPRVLEAVLQEQEKVVGDKPTEYQMVKDMELLDWSMKESLRLRPPIILIWRVAMQDFKYKDYVIPKGTYVCISPAVHGRTESIYTNPNEFDPWRFSPERQEDKLPYSYIAFSLGEHYCLGEKFAFLQVKLIWSIILRKYNVKLVGELKDYPVDNTTVMAGPVKPVTLCYTKKK